MRIEPYIIDQVRNANDIIDVIGASVRLKKRGKNFIGLCPFHQEKTPSFTVSQEKQMYHCFGCSKGGNVFSFVMETDKVSFVEAVKTLAGRAGITLEMEGRDSGQSSEIENLYNVCRLAGVFFHENLYASEEGKSALEYFHSRGFRDETIKAFGLGYSVASWDGFVLHAGNNGISAEHLVKAGLARKRDDGSLYDYFRGRAMFPILSTAGRVVGFGARKIREDDPISGKYINSPETPIYSKSRILFGLSHSKESVRSEDRALLVEGYADLISLFQAGIQNVVSSSGTALTSDQLQLLGRYTKNLTLVYDADSAGSLATLRGVDLALEQDFDVRVASLPAGEDPDSFVRRNGASAFRELVAKSISFIDFKMEQFRAGGTLSNPEGQTQAIRSVVQSIANIKDELKRNFYIKDVSQKYDLYESVLHRELDRWTQREKPSRSWTRNVAEGRPSPLVESTTLQEPPAAQRDILKLLLEGHVEIVRGIFDQISVSDLTDGRIRLLIERAFDIVEERGEFVPNSFIDELEEEELRQLVTDVTLGKYELSKGWAEMEVEIDEPDPWIIGRAAVARIRKQSIRHEIERNQKELKEVTQQGGDSTELIKRHQELMRQLQEVDRLALPKPSQPEIQ